jgi:Flp pilus assembly protein TadG
MALMEFALVSPFLFTVLLGIFDLGHRTYLNSVLYGAVQKAGRDSTLETAPAQAAAIKARIEDQVRPILLGSTVNITRIVTRSFTSAVGGEPFTDGNGNGTRQTGECFDDENGNGTWDSSTGAAGMGGTDDVVTLTATINYSHIFPFPSWIGGSNSDTLTAKTVLRNQPFGDAGIIARVCT